MFNVQSGPALGRHCSNSRECSFAQVRRIENGRRTLMALCDSSEYSWKHASQNNNSGSLLNCKRSVLSNDNSANCTCSRPIKSVSSRIQRDFESNQMR